jgi:hypothetical protein
MVVQLSVGCGEHVGQLHGSGDSLWWWWRDDGAAEGLAQSGAR